MYVLLGSVVWEESVKLLLPKLSTTNIIPILIVAAVSKMSKNTHKEVVLYFLQQLLASLLRRKDCKVPDVDSGIRQLGQILFSKKALVVLDNLDQSSCSEFLARYFSLFSVGSRIVVTTRDVNLLNQLNQVHVDIYMVDELGEVDSLKLFNYHSFGKVTPPANLENLSKSFVTYAGCLPLALKVLGSSLRGRTQDEVFWKAKLEKVRKILENGIMEILQLSYNELNDDTVKSIFLDIAFFFVGKYKNDAFYIFQSCDYFPEDGIQVLLDRCLITIDENNMFQMHDLIHDMGCKISKSTRLFLREKGWEYSKNQEELHKIEGLILDLTQYDKRQIDSQLFERMPNLRLLELFNAHNIKGHFENSLQELRCIYWSNCMWTQLPSSFRPQKLISFHMPSSNFKMLWDDPRPFTSLKILNVGYSLNLKTTPNFGNSKSVTELYFRNCENLRKVHPSIRELTGLQVLDLKECIKVELSAETLGQSSRLRYLYLGYCSNVRLLPKALGGMKQLEELDASYTAIKELPDSITQLKELVHLKLEGCEKLKKLPEQIGNIVGLRIFRASFSAIEQLPDSFAGLVNLEILDLRGCKNLRNLPNSIWKLKLLQILDLGYCSKLKRLPNELEKMQCLEELNASYTDIEEVPDSIGRLSTLRVLDLSFCEKLKDLPGSVWNLTSVTHLNIFQKNIDRINLPDEVKDAKLVTLALNCDIILWLPVILCFSSLKDLSLDGSESSSSTKPFSLSKLYNLRYLSLYICTKLFPELPLGITRSSLNDHFTLVHLPDLSSLKKLKEFGYLSLLQP
ncbi:TMV resistance protein N-like [Apium graveolens]|uniref:TMV resistance protein N-like n=1 Tax=Apium graveolens TaxID=4045 RepID=UPI003D7A9AF4